MSTPAAPGADLASLASRLGGRKLPPVHRWNPELCGDIDIRIARDGLWYYMGTPIGRQRLVELFASVLRREADGEYYLVTPVEKLRVRVDDAPFVAVEMEVTNPGPDQEILFRTNVNDVITAGASNPIRVETDDASGEPAPYIAVRDRLEALIARPVFYELVDLGEERDGARGTELVVWSAGREFSLGYVH